MPNIIKRAISKAANSTVAKPLVKRYHVVEARKLKEKQEIFERENTPEVKAARNKAYAEATYQNIKDSENRKAQYRTQGGRAGQVRRSVSEGLTGLSLGSANALKNDMYGVGKVDFGGFDSLTMGGPAGAGTLRNLEDITGFGGPRAKPKQLNPAVQGQSRGNIVINVGSSGSNKKRKPAAQIPQKQRDWQDDLEKLTGF
jgi:hypothetical protein